MPHLGPIADGNEPTQVSRPGFDQQICALLSGQATDVEEIVTRPLTPRCRPRELRRNLDAPIRDAGLEMLSAHEIADCEKAVDAIECAQTAMHRQRCREHTTRR